MKLDEAHGLVQEIFDERAEGRALSDEDCEACDVVNKALEGLFKAERILHDTCVGLWPEQYSKAEQVRAEVIREDDEPFTDPDNVREWDSETVEWCSMAVREALDALRGES